GGGAALGLSMFSLCATMYLPRNTSRVMSMSEATFTFRVDEALKSEFSTAAKSRDRNAAQLLRDFMRDFVRQQHEAAEHDAWFRRQVQIGLDSANSGNLVPSAEVEAKFAARRAETRRRLETSVE
ncbi:TPA: CopG family ribbon-helix-helix protein, partial [Serratia marcescens]